MSDFHSFIHERNEKNEENVISQFVKNLKFKLIGKEKALKKKLFKKMERN